MAVEIFEEGKVLWVKLNRPQALNAINEDVVSGLWKAIETAKSKKDLRAMVIVGEGKAFSAGADVRMFSESDYLKARKIVEDLGKALEALEELDIPVIAAVNGLALGGGCELAMACDIIIASENASFGQPEINLGIIPGAGGTQRLARIVGWKKAMELCMLGERISAKEALELGLVNKVVQHEKLIDEVRSFVEKLKTKSPQALAFVKRSVNWGFKASLREGIEFEREIFALAFASDDGKEGIKAFVEKRSPKFKEVGS